MLQIHPRVLFVPSTPEHPCVLHVLGQGLDDSSSKLLARADGGYLDIQVKIARLVPLDCTNVSSLGLI